MQYYENNCYHVTMASEGKDLMISCQHFVDSHVLEASATQITHVRLIRATGLCSDLFLLAQRSGLAAVGSVEVVCSGD